MNLPVPYPCMISFYIFFPRHPFSQVTCLCKICIAHHCPENCWDFQTHFLVDSYNSKSLLRFLKKRLTFHLCHDMKNNDLWHTDRHTDRQTGVLANLDTCGSPFCVISLMLRVIGDSTLQLFLSGIVNLSITTIKLINFVIINKKLRHLFKWTDKCYSHKMVK